MTSMLDQYNSTLKRQTEPKSINQHGTTTSSSSGYYSIRINEKSPIFSKQKMKLNLPQDILHLTVQNNWLITLMSHHVLLRLFLLRPDQQDEIFLDKFLVGGLRISNLFLDPSGNHLLIALTPPKPLFDGVVVGASVDYQSAELLYLHRKSNKPRKCDKFRDHEITAVGFNHQNSSTEASTGSILLGTSKGLLFECEFGPDVIDKRLQNSYRQVFDIGKGQHCHISGIEFHKVPNTMRFIVLVTTLDRLYKFQETIKTDGKSAYLYLIFHSYLNVPENMKDFHYVEKSLKYSKLQFIYNNESKFPKQFGWLTESGLFTGEIDSVADSPQFITTNEIIPFPEIANDNITGGGGMEILSQSSKSNTIDAVKKKQHYPISFVLTSFHVLFLYTDHITAVSLLNYQIVYEEYFTEQHGKLLDIIKDIHADTIYAFSTRSIFRYKITEENRNVWQLYLDKNEFELARRHCQDNPAHRDIVLVRQAELLFEQKDYLKSAIIFSETQSNFERVCLKFLEVGQKEALMQFLRNRIETIMPSDKIQTTMLVVWMVELYLTEIANYSEVSDYGGGDSSAKATVNHQRCRELQKEFDNFIHSPRVDQCVRANRNVIYNLMASHGDNFNLTSLTTVNKDYESVINQYINQANYSDALSILASQSKPDLLYKYCPILMEKLPNKMNKILMAQGKRLDPVKLLPTLICLDSPEHCTEIIKYLEFCIHSMGCTNRAIHNFLVKLYAQYKQDSLLMYLEEQGKDDTLVNYDIHYALRVCGNHGAKKACAFLQCLLELWHSAVELALTFDIKLAKQMASQPIDRDLSRKLWLQIAEHEIKDKDDVRSALELLKECDLLRIEDLLPFFSDFEKIDHFKDAICDALKDYNLKIQEQRRDMDESAKSADRVREELQTVRNRSVTISAQEPCSICPLLLLLKPFFIFPCGHSFHADCLEMQLMSLMPADKLHVFKMLKQQLNSFQQQQLQQQQQQQQPGSSTLPISDGPNNRDSLKMQYERILSSDCVLCGEFMIDSIDKPFGTDNEQLNDDWL